MSARSLHRMDTLPVAVALRVFSLPFVTSLFCGSRRLSAVDGPCYVSLSNLDI